MTSILIGCYRNRAARRNRKSLYLINRWIVNKHLTWKVICETAGPARLCRSPSGASCVLHWREKVGEDGQRYCASERLKGRRLVTICWMGRIQPENVPPAGSKTDRCHWLPPQGGNAKLCFGPNQNNALGLGLLCILCNMQPPEPEAKGLSGKSLHGLCIPVCAFHPHRILLFLPIIFTA